jgi:thiosulfate dehydrogenase [quinone] large subunit
MKSPSPATRPRSAPAARRLTDDPLWVLLPLRAFLAVVFLYAGLSKIADRRFLDSNDPTSMHQTTQAIKAGSPIGGLLGPVIDHSFAFGLLMACAELAVGIGIAFGLFTRIAAVGGVLLTCSLFLTVSWQSNPWYTGADIVYVFALTPLILAGRTPLSVDDWLARTYAPEDEQLPMRRAMLAGGAAVLGLVALGAASLFRQKPQTSNGQPPQPGQATASESDSSETTVSAGQVPVGGGRQVTDASTGQAVWVLQLTAGDFSAFNATCPHQGCPVRFQGASGGFRCPCHGSRFTSQGKVTSGPATRNLTEVKVTKSGDTLKLG